MNLLPRYDFVTPCIGHWENSASLNFTYLPNSNFFILEYKKNPPLVISLLTSREKSLNVGQLSSLWWPIPVFQNCAWNFRFLETLHFYHWQQMVSVVFLEVMSSLYSLSRICLSNTRHPLKYKWCSMKKTEMLMSGSHLVTHNIQRLVLKGLDLMKLIVMLRHQGCS